VIGLRTAAATFTAFAFACSPALGSSSHTHGLAPLRVSGKQLVADSGKGRPIRLLGVDRSGTEYACIEGWGFFDSPHPQRIDDPTMLKAIKSWDVNAVRVPLNEDCWLGINGPRRYIGAPYRAKIERYVAALHRAGFYVILDLHVAAPGAQKATRIDPMPDADHAPAFWGSVARAFKGDHALVFDLYNEPHGVGWRCWLHGCRIPARTNGKGGHLRGYRAAGMQQLLDAVRATGATQPVMAGGIDWARDLRRWIAHRPHDPLHQLVASEHNYGGLAPCGAGCRSATARVAGSYPVVVGELGETDCSHAYIDSFMSWADRHGVSYLGWAWDATAPGDWNCRTGPALITSYYGTPTRYGGGFRNHFRKIRGT
jgi:hypothetical protein